MYDIAEAVAEVKRTLRDVQPSHYILKIKSFSAFLHTEIGKYESGVFDAGGYKWKLSIFIEGNEKRNVENHISLYLAICDTCNLPFDVELNVNFKLFVFDHIRDKYLTIEYAEPVRRFHVMKTEWGFDKFLSLEEFQDPSNGYLVDDTSIFGAEVFVMRFEGKGECLSMKKLQGNTYTWKIDHFSEIREEYLCSDLFEIGGWNWRVYLYPDGNGNAEVGSVSMFLEVADYEKLYLTHKLYAKYKLRIRNLLKGGEHQEMEGSYWFCPTQTDWGFLNFMSLTDLSDNTMGFIENDTIIVEVEIEMLSDKRLSERR